MATGSAERRLRGLGALLIVTAIAVVGCAGAATPTPSPSPSPSPSPVPSPSPSPSPLASASPSPSASADDPAEDVAIAAPYTLEELPAELASQLESGITGALASSGLGSMIQVGGRQISKDGQAEGFLLVVAVPPLIADNPAFMEGLTGSFTGEATTKTIDGTDVLFATQDESQVAVFKLGGDLFLVYAPTAVALTAQVTALITAS
jgi:hypothetical protein